MQPRLDPLFHMAQETQQTEAGDEAVRGLLNRGVHGNKPARLRMIGHSTGWHSKEKKKQTVQ